MITQIIWFLVLPVMIWISYRLALVAVKRFEKNAGREKVEQ